MKKVFIAILAFLILTSLAACSCGKPGANSTDTSVNAPSDSQPAGNESAGGDASQNSSPASEPEKLTGKLNLIDLDDRDPSVLRGVILTGNQVGTAEFNSRESSLTDVRCIFDLNEWIEFYPDTDKEYALRVWVLKHRDDQEYYNTCKFSDLMPNFASYCDLHYPADEENPDEYPWGSFYLNGTECEPGYYDFVFTYEGKAIAVLLTRFYDQSELGNKSDAELEALMRE